MKRFSRQKIICILITIVLSLFILTYILITLRENKKSRLISENAIRTEVSSTPSFRFRKEPNDLTDEDFSKITYIDLQSASNLKDAKDIIAGNARPHYVGDRPSDGRAVIYDLEFIGKLTNLERLYLRNLPFYNVDVPKWKDLLYKYHIYDPYKKKPLDLSPLKTLKNLKYLNVYNTEVKSFVPLAESENLEGLSISATPIRNKNQLSKLQNIKNLLLLDVEFRDITPLVKLRNLEELTLSNTHVSDFKPLKEMTNLKSLTLNNEKINDFGIINDLVNLQELKLSKVEINDLSLIKDLKNLRLLALQDISVRDLTLLKQFPDLKEVWISSHGSISGEQISELKKAIPDIKVIDCYMFFEEDFDTYID